MNKLLTIGIPAYNVEKYIAECLDSLLPELLPGSLEILVINDGSKDRTAEIALEYEKKYPDTVRLINKANGGWGSGVNLAIKEAKGKYFKNLDSDDKYAPAGLKKMLENMALHEADLFIAPSLSWNESTGSLRKTHMPSGTVFNRVLPLEELLSSVSSEFWMHSLAFRTELLQSNGIEIDECFYTDSELAMYPIAHAKTAFAQEEPVYIYRTGRAGQSMSLGSMAKHMDNRELVTLSVLKKFRSEEWKSLPAQTRSYLAAFTRVCIYSYLTQPFAIRDAAQQSAWLEKLRAFKLSVIDAEPELSDYGSYLLLARLLLKNNFRGYSLMAALWRFGKTKIAPVANVILSLLGK